jgi:hypothetical protein
MNRRAPSGKRAPAQWKKEDYYWRGGDVHQEKEYLLEEFKKATREYRKAEWELQHIQKDIQQASETLSEKEEYTQALAGFLDSDTAGGMIEVDVKKKLVSLQQQINVADQELQQLRARQNPAVAGSLLKEKAYLLIENQRVDKAVDIAKSERETASLNWAGTLAGERYHAALMLNIKVRELSQKCKYLRRLVRVSKEEFDKTPTISGSPPSEPDACEQRNALRKGIEIDEIVRRIEEKKERRPKKWNDRLNRLVDCLGELNDVMAELQMEEEMVDIEAIRQHYVGQN